MCSDWDRAWGNCKDETPWYEEPKSLGGVVGWVTGGLSGAIGGAAIGGAVGDALKPPDYSGPEGAAQKALDEDKKRRATEANRRDMQASQLARLFLSDTGAQEETFNFMGL
jgi:hypothetical protein